LNDSEPTNCLPLKFQPQYCRESANTSKVREDVGSARFRLAQLNHRVKNLHYTCK
jgi:hypothetical protein